jgi:Tol biopolymer transport system component
MSETKELLRRGVGDFEPMPDAFDRVLDRRERKERNRRIRAGALGVIVALATGIIFVRSMTSDGIPADQPVEPRPAPVPSGALAYALHGNIYVADPDGSNAVEIADATADTGCDGISEYWIPDPPWSPDGRYLSFERTCSSSEHNDVVITDPHGNVVGEVPTYGGGWGFTWSPDSRRVAVWEPALTIGVYGVDGERQASLPEPTLKGGGNDAAPAWMSDGSALLLFGYGVVPLDGSAVHELSTGREYSPDGTRYAEDIGRSLAFYDADGSPLSNARLGGDHDENGWSPDGERFAALADGELNVIDVASGTVTLLPEARAALDDGDEILGVRGFSPQGDRILYATGHYATGDGPLVNAALWSIGADGSDARRLIAGTTGGEWRPR